MKNGFQDLQKTHKDGYNMKILVTGAGGFLGRGIVKALLDMGHSVIAVDFSTELVDSRAIRKNCNLFKLENPYEYTQNPEVLLHLAWRDGFVHNSVAHMEDLPKHCLFISRMMDSGIKRVSIMGTMHEIGFYEGSIDENTPCHPMNMYGIAKNALREASKLLSQQHNIPWQWLRGYYIVDNTSYGNSIFSKICTAVQENKTEFPFTTGQNQYDFLDYEDFCLRTAAAAAQDDINGIINICSGKPEKLCDRVERFIKENNFAIKLKYGAFPDRAYDSKAVWGNSSKIDEILNNK